MFFLNIDDFGCNKGNEMLNRSSLSVVRSLGVKVADIIIDERKSLLYFNFLLLKWR